MVGNRGSITSSDGQLRADASFVFGVAFDSTKFVPNFAYGADKGKVYLGLLLVRPEFVRDLCPIITAMQLISI